MLWSNLCCWQGPGEFPAQQNQTFGWKLCDLNSAKLANTLLLLCSSIMYLLRLQIKGVKGIFSVVSLPAELINSDSLTTIEPPKRNLEIQPTPPHPSPNSDLSSVFPRFISVHTICWGTTQKTLLLRVPKGKKNQTKPHTHPSPLKKPQT